VQFSSLTSQVYGTYWVGLPFRAPCIVAPSEIGDQFTEFNWCMLLVCLSDRVSLPTQIPVWK